MEINVNVQTSTENQQSTNDNHNYDNRRITTISHFSRENASYQSVWTGKW